MGPNSVSWFVSRLNELENASAFSRAYTQCFYCIYGSTQVPSIVNIFIRYFVQCVVNSHNPNGCGLGEILIEIISAPATSGSPAVGTVGCQSTLTSTYISMENIGMSGLMFSYLTLSCLHEQLVDRLSYIGGYLRMPRDDQLELIRRPETCEI